ncbi:MAG: hypothetical protein WCO65_03030 [bacterium]
MMSSRKKIILISVAVILILAVVWFLYQKNQQSKNVQSGTGNVSSLFPFTGTNTTNFQKEPNSGLPQKNNSGSVSSNNGSGNGTGNGTGGDGYDMGNVLNLNDLTVGNNNLHLGLPTDNCTGSGCGGSGGNGTGGGGGCPPSGCSPYAGEISLTANGSVSAGVTSDGGNVELVWVVAKGQIVDTTCIANSSNSDWIGTKSSTGGTEKIIIPANTGATVLSRTYSINCINIGQSSVTVNIPPVSLTDIIKGSSVTITANRSQSADLSSAGGNVRLDWSVKLPMTGNIGKLYTAADYAAMGISCTAQSSASDWTGSKAVVGSDSVSESQNTGSDIISNTYTISCTRVGEATATVNIGPLSGTIKGSSVTITANRSQSADLSSAGGNVRLDWSVKLPMTGNIGKLYTAADYAAMGISCTAQSSASDWTGSKAVVGSDSVSESQNTGSDIISNTYTISCTRVGEATATVNIGPLNEKMTGVINGAVNLTVDGSSSSLVDASGGTASLAWTVDTGGKSGVTCKAQSSAGDWTGIKNATSGVEIITIPPNTGTSTLSQSYTMVCDTIGSSIVTVNRNMPVDAFADKTPEFLFTANGGTNVTVAPGTPVELDWETRNINGNSCVATSDGSYAGWGTEYVLSSNPLSAKDQTDLATYQGQLLADQTNLAALTATNTGTQTVSLADLASNIATNKTLLNTTVSNITQATSNISNTNAILQTTTNTISTITNQLNDQKNTLTLLNNQQNSVSGTPTLGGLVLDATTIGTLSPSEITSDIAIVSNTITTLQTQLNTGVSTKNTLTSQLTAQQSTLSTLSTQKQTLQNQITNLQTQYNQAQTVSQITKDLTVAQQIKNLQYQIQVLQGKIADINAKLITKHLSVKSRGKTIKQPYTDVGPTSASFSEVAGIQNVIVTGTDNNGKKISGGDGSGGGIIGDTPITTKRVYTLTCSGINGVILTPQTVTINVDNNQSTQVGQLSTDPALTFLVNGSTTANVNVGDSVKLTWQVANLPANSCRATSDGSYDGWGATYQKVMHIRTANGTIIDNTKGYAKKPGDFIFYTNDLLTDPGGTVKAPTANVGTNAQTFTETIGADNSITTTRTYTLTCGDIPPQTVTVNVSNSPNLTLLIDGSSSENIPAGGTGTLTWSVQNIKGGSCRGTSNGNTDPSSGGNFYGWGAAYGTAPLITSITGRTSNQISTLISVPGGTSKAPSTDVNSVPKIFTEKIGQDGSFTTAERTYTLTCTGLDGSTLTQTVDINGPSTGSSVSSGGGTFGNENDPCASDMDINMAKINLQNFITEYKTITGNDIDPNPASFDSKGNPIEFDKQGNRINLIHDDSANSSIDSCVADLNNAKNDPSNPNYYKGPMNFLPYAKNLFNVDTDMANLPSDVNRGASILYGRSPSFLPDWVWVDQDSVLHPEHDGEEKYRGATWTWNDQTNIATACMNGGSSGPGLATCSYGDSNFVGYGIYVGDLVDLSHIAYDGDGEGSCPKGQACIYTHFDSDTSADAYNGQAFTIPHSKYDSVNDIYTGSDGTQKDEKLGFCFKIGTNFGKGSGGYPLINTVTGGIAPVSLESNPNTFNIWTQANNAGALSKKTLNYGAVEISEGNSCENLLFYQNDDLGLWGQGIGYKIEQEAGFY